MNNAALASVNRAVRQPAPPNSAPIRLATGGGRDEQLVGGQSFSSAYAALRPCAVGAAAGVLHDTAAAEDVAQEVFLEIWRHPQKFDRGRGSLRLYVTVLARSRALDRARTESARRRAAERFETVAPARTAPAAVDEVVSAANASCLLKALKGLPYAVA